MYVKNFELLLSRCGRQTDKYRLAETDTKSTARINVADKISKKQTVNDD